MSVTGEYEPSPRQWVRDQVELFESSGIGELEIAEGEERVRITRNPPPAAGQAYSGTAVCAMSAST